MLRLPTGLPGKSLKTQLTALLFALTTVVIVVLSFLGMRAIVTSGEHTSQIAEASMRQRAKQLLEQTVTATADKNSLIFKNVEDETISAAKYTKNLLENPGNFSNKTWHFDDHVHRRPAGNYGNSADEPSSIFIQSALKVTPAMKREMELTSYLDDLFPLTLANEDDAVAIYFEGPQGETRYYPNIELEKLVPPDYDSTTGEYFTVANPQNNPEGVFKMVEVYDDPAGNGLTITAAQPIYTASKVFLGMVDMDVTLNKIAKNIESYSPLESSYAFLVDNAGRAIALPAQGYHDLLGREAKTGEFGSDLSAVKDDFGPVLANMRSGKRGFTAAKVRGTGLYVAYAPVADTPFSLGIVAREAVMLKVVTDVRQQLAASTDRVLYHQFLPVGILIMLAVWFFGFWYIRRLTEPIKSLTTKTAEVASGNFDVPPAVVRDNNEIGQLASSFNRMVGDLRSSRAKIAQQTQELLRNEQTRLKASINSLHVGFIMTDINSKVIMLNGAALALLSKDRRHQWTTEEIDERLGSEAGFKEALTRVAKTGRSVEKPEVKLESKILSVFIAPILNDHPGGKNERLGAVVLIEDITEAKLLEQARDDFFSIASHELRTPLTAVRGNAALLQQEYSAKVHEQPFDEMVGDIHDASVRLIEIVNDFLDATRLEQGRITFENATFAIHEVVKAVTYEMATVAKLKDTQLKMGADLEHMPLIYADKNRVKQVVYNLLGNALKFTEKGTITIDAQVDGSKLKVLVRDTGSGIPEDSQRLLFRKFQQASNGFTTRESRGTGLGLYISKLLTEQMGGRIALEHSEVGVGTTFSFTVPLAKDEQGAATKGLV